MDQGWCKEMNLRRDARALKEVCDQVGDCVREDLPVTSLSAVVAPPSVALRDAYSGLWGCRCVSKFRPLGLDEVHSCREVRARIVALRPGAALRPDGIRKDLLLEMEGADNFLAGVFNVVLSTGHFSRYGWGTLLL